MNTFDIKEGNNAEDLQMLTPKMMIVLGHFMVFAKSNNLPVTITNIKHKFKESISNTHPEGRAVDVSVKKWSKKDIERCEIYLNDNALQYGAISLRTGYHRVVLPHDIGKGPHFHLQVSR